MVKPTSLVRMALRAKRQPVPFSVNEATANQARAKCVLLHDVPRTALPSDIQRALVDVGAVDKTFSVSSITSLPPSLPKTPSLYRSVHLTLPSAGKASEVSKVLSTKPIFNPTIASRFNRPSSSSSSSRAVQLTHVTSNEWTEKIISKALQDRSQFEKERDKDLEKTFTPEWSNKSGLSGRRVIIKGLPGSLTKEDVRRLGKDCGVVDDYDGCVKLPSSRLSHVSTFCLTTNTVNDAHRLARKIHMKWYKVDVHGQRWLMRAHVHY